MTYKKKIGVLAGCFDIIHPGYIYMFEEAKYNCDKLIVLLQTDPTIDRPEKNKPILSLNERIKILESIKYIDEIVIYGTEKELYELLKKIKPDVRFLGDDYIGKEINGGDLNIKIIYINRKHGWSSTKFKQLIFEQLYNKNKNYMKEIDEDSVGDFCNKMEQYISWDIGDGGEQDYKQYLNTNVGEKIEDIIKNRVYEILNNSKDVEMPNDIIETDNIGEVIEKLAILHCRMWYLEDAIGLATSDEEVASLKRKIDICFKQKRPKYVEAVNRMIDKSIIEGKSLIEDSVKLYKGHQS
jgi:glycerol-3-phosphate cytidylyltransferase